MTREVRVRYRPTPTLAEFHQSPAFVRGVMGPLGSGKSSAMCAELLMRALGQRPGPDGVRRSRFAVVRNTYPELRTTTLKTWADWVPETICPVGRTAPMSARLREALGDGTRIEMEAVFLALDRPSDIKKLLSLELTGAWINEAREVERAVVDGLTGRVGRYPPRRLGGPSWSGLFMDTNPPGENHWWYRLAEEDRPEGWEFFRQPPAVVRRAGRWEMNPGVENASNQPLGPDYWRRQLAGKGDDWIHVYLAGGYGSVRSGKPVYPEYDDAVHMARERVAPLPGRELILGWDFGLAPACVATQLCPRGRLLVLREFVSRDTGIRRFVREVVAPGLAEHFPGLAVRSVGDPAGKARAQTDERTCMQELAEAGLPTSAARTNDFLARREAVAGFLSARPDGMPGVLLSRDCPELRRGFLSEYRYARLNDSGEERYAERPLKNAASHVHDALQYAALSAEDMGRPRALRRKRTGGPRGGPAQPSAGY